MDRSQYDHVFKLLVVGDSGVGKSSLLLRLADNTFSESFISTIGVDFKIRVLKQDGELIKLQAWTPAGQEKSQGAVALRLYRGVQGVLLVYDVTDRLSFQSIPHWVRIVRGHVHDDADMMLLGSKCDLKAGRAVSPEEAQALAHSLGVPFFETSAKSCHNVEEAFGSLARSIRQRVGTAPAVYGGGVPLVELGVEPSRGSNNEIGRFVTVRGIKSFSPEPKKWPHPHVFIGCGYNGIKHALYWAHHNFRDFVMYDRYDRVGGHAWLTQANKTSKLQTEMCSFHVWFGKEWDDNNQKLSYPFDWATWPKKDEIIAHLEHACERYSLLPHMRLGKNVVDMVINGKLTDPDRNYTLTVQSMKKTSEMLNVTTSCMFHFPCAYFTPRIIEYPGESSFDGQIGYGMNDDIPFDYLEGSKSAILGNGAFAVENIRTCCEYGVEKVYLVTRKKNLPSPRLSCWFVHQSIVPVPAAMVLNTFQKMFEDCGFGDPWEYHSVFATKDKSKCTIVSNSRFGIGDVTFLAVAWGRCEYVQDLVKRCSHHCLHLEGGGKLDGVTNIIKCLGLLADFGCDKLHKAKEFIGPWANGDFRRIIYADPLGMNAANFSTFSTGIGSYIESVRAKYLLDYPQEYKKVQDSGIIDMFPRSKATESKPAHHYDAKYAQTYSMLLEGVLPGLVAKYVGVDDYMSRLYHAVNPPEKTYEECRQAWDQYQNDWWKMGFEHEYVPYPYTMDDIWSWFDEYGRTVGPTSVEAKEQWEEHQKQIMEENAVPVAWDGEGSKMWWKYQGDMEAWASNKTNSGGG